jgi:hypothetical protein
VSVPEFTAEAIRSTLRGAGIPEYDPSDPIPMGWRINDDAPGGAIRIEVKIHSRLEGPAAWRRAVLLRGRAALRAARYRAQFSDDGTFTITVKGVVRPRP